MTYEINVSLNGIHLFATAKRSLQSEDEARSLLHFFMSKFPIDEGYDFTVTKETRYNERIDL